MGPLKYLLATAVLATATLVAKPATAQEWGGWHHHHHWHGPYEEGYGWHGPRYDYQARYLYAPPPPPPPVVYDGAQPAHWGYYGQPEY